MAQVTQTYKRTFSGSVGAGIGSLIGGGRQYYLLEHRISSRYHRAGETQEIIVDQIELGRDPSCQVRFDESFTTVSRRHAAIVRDGDKWKLVQLSQTNPTLLNGNTVGQEWYLQSGDEIQLAVGGPKLGFIIPSGNRTGSIGLTRRLGLFGQQALRPYRHAIVLLSVALLLAIVGLTTWKLHSDRIAGAKINGLTIRADSLETESKKQYIQFQIQQDSIETIVKKSKIDNKKMQEEIAKLKSGYSLRPSSPKHKSVSIGTTLIDNAAIEACLPFVYFIYVEKIEVIMPNKEKFTIDDYGWTATGFLLDDGRLVTARHVVEPWYFVQSYNDSINFGLNSVATNGGKVTVHFQAISPKGDRFSFTNEEAVCHRSDDEVFVLEDGYEIRLVRRNDGDWAYFNTSKDNGLKIDKNAAQSLARGVELTVLGFPFGLGANSANDIKPVWGHALTASEGLTQGVILTTDTNFEQGNSGGPALYTDSDGNLIVIGIVSREAGRSTGFIVPISSIY
jgi:pSer/pThr/pTyr-binding forkhead associated (FHA) protein